MKVIGITGPTGSGKTTALRVLEELGAKIIDCDRVYHALMVDCAEMKAAIAEAFPECSANGAIDRKALGSCVFSDPQALEKLNRITHGYVVREVERLLRAHEQAGGQLAGIDAIALIESGLGTLCDFTVAVIAPVEVRVARLMAREGISEDYARLRIAAQKGEEFFRQNCTYILENTGLSQVEFEEKALTFFKSKLDGGGEDAR